MRKNSKYIKASNSIIILILMFLMSVIYVFPLFMVDRIPLFESQDMLFHLSRISGLNNVWTSPVNFNNFAHHGTMMNVFYPWLTLYPVQLFITLTGSLILSYKIYIWLITVLTLLLSYFSVFKIKSNKLTAVLFSVSYTFATYRTIDIYRRASLGEAIALTFLPLVFLGVYEVFFRNYCRWYYLAIGMTLIVYSHLLSVMMTSIIIFIAFCFSFYFWDNKRKRVLSLIKAAIATLLLSAGFLGPFLQQTFYVKLNTPDRHVLTGVNPSDFIIQSLNNDAYSFSLGFFTLAVLFLSVSLVRNSNLEDRVIYYFSIFIVFSTTSLFPWVLFSNSFINVIQFVWRLNCFSTLLILYSFSVFVTRKKLNSKGYVKPLMIIPVCILLITLHSSSLINLMNHEIDFKLTDSNSESLASEYFHLDYVNKNLAKNADLLKENKFLLNGKELPVKYSYNDNFYSVEVNNTAHENSELSIPISRYLGQKIDVNGKKSSSELSKYGTTLIDLPKGISIIKISYSYTMFAYISFFVSVISFVVFLAFFIKNKIYKSN